MWVNTGLELLGTDMSQTSCVCFEGTLPGIDLKGNQRETNDLEVSPILTNTQKTASHLSGWLQTTQTGRMGSISWIACKMGVP